MTSSQQIELLNKKLTQAKTRRAVLREQLVVLDDKLNHIEDMIKTADRSAIIITTEAKNTQTFLMTKISDLVTLAMKTVYPEGNSFQLQIKEGNGKPEAIPIFIDPLQGEMDPLSSKGGGPISLCCFGLRCTMLTMQNPEPRRVLFMDEPFLDVQKDKLHDVGSMLRQISKKLNIQIVLVSHEHELIELCEKTILLEKDKNGVARAISE